MGPVERELRRLPVDCSLDGARCLLSVIWLLADCCAHLGEKSVFDATKSGRFPELLTEAIEAAEALGL